MDLGTGEALNEHISGAAWPSADKRLAMLDEAVQIFRELLTGCQISHIGDYYTVETARLYSVPDVLPPVFVSGFGEKAIKLVGPIADGCMCAQPNADFVRLCRESGADQAAQLLPLPDSGDQAGGAATVRLRLQRSFLHSSSVMLPQMPSTSRWRRLGLTAGRAASAQASRAPRPSGRSSA